MANTHIPASLHKYFPPERIGSLESQELAFSPLNTFNDPFEGRPDIKGLVTKEHLTNTLLEKLPGAIERQYRNLPRERRRLLTLEQFRKKMLEMARTEFPKEASNYHSLMTGMAQELPDRMSKIMGALCLCETRDSLLMWAHYAKSHTGFTVEFDSSSPFFNRKRTESDEHYHLRRVLYRSRRPSGQLLDFDGNELFLVKSDDWSYEKEWRMFAPLENADRELSLDDGITISLFKFPLSCVRSVTIGSRAATNIRDRIKALASSSKDHEITVYQAAPSKSHFMLDFEKLAI